MSVSRKNRNPSIDILRAFAILLVLGRHMKTCPPETNIYLSSLTELWQRVGWTGVDLFFVLSGFLVSSLLFQENLIHSQIDIKRFLVRRGFKIYPSFWIFIGFTIVYWKANNYPLYLSNLLGELFFLQNYIGNFWGYTWSLAVEEHFYILLVIILYWLNQRDLKFRNKTPFLELPQISIIILVACLALRYITAYISSDSDSYTLLFPTHLRIDSLMFGVLIAWLWHFKLSEFEKLFWFKRLYLTIMGLFFVFVPFVANIDRTINMFTFGLSFLYFGFGLLILGTINLKIKSEALLKCLTYIGYCSYSIYLWHGPVNLWLIPSLGKFISPVFISNWYIYFLSYFVGSIAIGCLATNMVEKPLLSLRNKIFPSRTRTLKF